MHRIFSFLIIIIGVICIFSCTETPTNPPVRDNPLDEQNPETGGDPFNLTAQIAGGGIQLSWETVEHEGVIGYNIHRSIDDGSFTLYHEVNGRTTASYTDTGIENGHKYSYYIVTRNTEGQESTSNTAEVEINNTPHLSIDQGNYTPTRTVDLTLLAFGAVSMQIGTPDLTGAGWITYSTTADIELETATGNKTVQVRFAYADGDTSEVVSDNIQPQPMNASFTINHDSTYSETRDVWLFPSVQGSNLQYKFSEDSTFSGVNWKAFADSVQFTLPTGAGIKTVYGKFKNDFEIVESDSDTIEPLPMNASFNINNNAPETELADVSLFLSAQGANLHFKASEDNSFNSTSWQNYVSQSSFALSSGIGTKTVYIKFKNDFEIESAVLSDSISYVYCFAPNSLSAEVDELSISLSWTDNSAVEEGYKIERKESGGNYSQIAAEGQNVDGYTDSSGLISGTTYYYQVRAFNSQGNSGYSNEADGMAAISAPSGLSAQGVSETSFELAWQDNSGVEAGYKIERKESGGYYSEIAIVGQNVETYADNGLSFGTTYYYRVCAYVGVNNSTYSNEVSGTTTYPAGYEQTFALGTTGETIEMVWIPSGSFMQGRYAGEQGSSSNEDPPHLVTLDYGFWLGKYELTQGQWEAVTGSNPSYYSGANRPVEEVSWNMITNDFLPTLNLQTSSGEWRLPSESEWEYACRAGTETRYYWGDDLNETMIGDYAVYYLNDPGGTAEVGTKLPNAWNLYDMSGNVWEWCVDYGHDNYTGAPNNGDPWLSPTSSYRVLRGGSWGYSASSCRSANRNFSSPSNAYYYYGFRMVFSP